MGFFDKLKEPVILKSKTATQKISLISWNSSCLK